MHRALAFFAALLWLPLARAEDQVATGGTSISYEHKGQFGIYAQFGIGYRAIFRYNVNDYCGTAGQGVCTGLAPPYMEIGLSYAPISNLELITDFRIGLTDDFRPDTAMAKAPRQLVLAPGIKLYVNDRGSLKWFTTFQLAFDFSDYSVDNVSTSVDLAFRNVNGILVDLHRTFGVYAQFGETVGFVRWLRFEMTGGVGMQARFP